MSYAIQNQDGEHLGFLLFEGEGEKGECIFRCLPTKPEHFETAESQFLAECQEDGEFEWSTSGTKIGILHPIIKKRGELENGELKIGNYVYKAISISAT